MRCWLISLCVLVSVGVPCSRAATEIDIDQAPHQYRQREPKDRFTGLKADLESGKIPLDASSEKAFVRSLLHGFEVPASSQTLVFSTTSLQLSRISPATPRALYFSEDLYIGYVVGGRIEIISIDPELGGVFYIFDIPRDGGAPRAERSERCMNCHSGEETRFIPGLLIKSVIPGPTGGSLDAYRQQQSGHGVPLEQRFGGWYVTGAGGFTNHWGNLTGRLSREGLTTYSVQPGERFDLGRYVVPTSDLLAHLLHEHQVGFVNRAVEASYVARTYLHADGGTLTPAHRDKLDHLAHELTRYILFADEVPLPPSGVTGDPTFKAEFLRNRRPAANGAALKDFDLRKRIFKYRCSYMIYSAAFQGLPPEMKQRVYRNLWLALKGGAAGASEFSYLSDTEKQTIATILRETLPDLPAEWGG